MTVQTEPSGGGTIIEARRRELDLTREQLGVAAGGVATSTIRRLERGIGKPHRSTIAALLRALEDAERAR